MAEIKSIAGSDLVKNSRSIINDNFKAVASDFAGTAFPTTNLYVGMTCYRTDLKKVYRYVADNTWRLENDLSGVYNLVAEASHASKATSDSNGRNIESTYLKNVYAADGNIVVVKGDGTQSSTPYNDNNNQVYVETVPAGSKEYALVLNKAGQNPTTDTMVMDTLVTVNPSTHTVTAKKFVGDLTGSITGNAVNDKLGQQIDSTYVKSITLNGSNVVIAKGNGDASSIRIDTNFETTGTVTASTQGARKVKVSGINVIDETEGSGDLSKYYLKVNSGLAAGTYTLARVLQELVNKSHTHSTLLSKYNCDCNCNCDCGDDSG